MRKADYREQIFIKQPQDVVQIDSDICYPVNVYIGVYEINDLTLPVSVMCDRAIMAIKTIKGNYEKRIAYYDEALRDEVLQEQEMAGCLESAIEEGQFRLYLQPQTRADGQAMGAEALVRWQHPQKGLLMPGDFIEALEKNGMIVKLDQHVWELACMQLREWKEQGKTQMYLSVNISPRDFYFLDIYRVFTELVKKYEIDAHNLKLEITETAVMMNLEQQLNLIEKLRKSGFVIEMDDFGSGYSSLNMLKDIQVDILKIDMAFLGKSSDEERGRKILKMVIELSKGLGMPVITEGVETREQVDSLLKMGCDMFQGYYFAKPMPVAEFEEKYMGEDTRQSIA
jgi:EAL domain-containing protein (putative c-di-GMP-specific phosphodiesterase class I)